MTLSTNHPGWRRHSLVVLSALAIGSGDAFANVVLARTAVSQAPESSQDSASPIPAEQLDSLVSPIALYPDPLLAQVLAASTYPLELIQLQQWLEKNSGLKGKALADAMEKQPWDPSVQAMAGLPDVVKWLTNDIQWTADLGNAFLAQQADVMSAVQRMRHKAEAKGTLKSTEQQVVETKTEGGTQVIVIEQANPEVIYVPSYNPTVVYGAPIYPYPPIYYPPSGYYAGAAIGFGVGVAMGAFWGGGGWGWNCGWGRGDLDINVNNNFNRNANINRNANFNRNASVRGGNTWQHNPAHRGGAPYSNRATANKFGGTARGDSLANRQTGARQQINRQGGQVGGTRDRQGGAVGTGGVGNRPGGGVGDRGGAGGNRPGAGGGISDRPGGGAGNRPSQLPSGGSNRPGAGDRPGGGGGISDRPGAGSGNRPSTLPSNRPGGGGNFSGNRPSTLPSGGGADRVGSRDLSRGSGSSAFGGGSRGGYDGASARSSSSRGSSSARSRSSGGGGGGRSRGGGGGGGRSRGGGGRR